MTAAAEIAKRLIEHGEGKPWNYMLDDLLALARAYQEALTAIDDALGRRQVTHIHAGLRAFLAEQEKGNHAKT